jgi:5'-3' exonuclease
MKYLVFDISNLLYRSFFVQRQEDDETLAGLATHTALVMLNKYYKAHKPDKVVMAFDRKSWRKEYTASEECLSKKPYKGNRRQDMTESQKLKYERFIAHMREFEALISEQTTIMTLVQERLEADDVIAGFCQFVADEDNEIVIISTDSDLLQLLRYTNVRIVSPANDKEQFLSDYDQDPLFYLFTKCLRGDPTDNVQSAYPRVSSKRIRAAYDDPFEQVKLMNETWTNQDKVEFRVKDLYAENQKLIDLSMQPEDIRDLIDLSIAKSLTQKKQFSMFFILKFLGKYKLNKIKESLDQYIPMLSN